MATCFPFLPIWLSDVIGLNKTETGIVFSSLSLFAICFQPILGVISDKLIGAGYKGYSIYAQNFGELLISTNNIFPRGTRSVHLSGVVRSCVTSNRFHSFYPGMLIMENNCAENLISTNPGTI